MEPFKNIIRAESIEHIIMQFEKIGLAVAREVLKTTIPKLNALELKDRVLLVKDSLKLILPTDPKKSFLVIHKMLAPMPERSGLGNGADHSFGLNPKGLDGFLLWPFSEYVADVGIDHLDDSLIILKEITQRFTAEFAIRPFILKYPKSVYKTLSSWSTDESEHVRRLCSEGARPRLPWGIKLTNAVIDPQDGIKILEKLKFDESLYVRKSVANHLNDISKDHPEIVIKLLAQWLKLAPKKHLTKIQWIVSQAGRTLIKKGHPEMLKLMGVNHEAKLKVSRVKQSQKKIKIGESLVVQGEIQNLEKKDLSCILDYQVGYARASGKVGLKVFKGKKSTITARGSICFEFKINFSSNSLRKIYPGTHHVSLLLNGKEVAVIHLTISL
jgi:3-methyladenine DNA glycosylase AlkC